MLYFSYFGRLLLEKVTIEYQFMFHHILSIGSVVAIIFTIRVVILIQSSIFFYTVKTITFFPTRAEGRYNPELVSLRILLHVHHKSVVQRITEDLMLRSFLKTLAIENDILIEVEKFSNCPCFVCSRR